MFPFKIIVFLSLTLIANLGLAQGKTAERKPAQVLMEDHVRVEFAYISWKEFVDVEPSATQPATSGDFIGNAISIQYEHYFRPRWGSVLEGSILFGQANLGAPPNYQEGNVNWWGLSASYRAVYRFSSQVSSSLGALILNRQIEYPTQVNVTDVTSGAVVNYGVVVDFNYLLTPHWLVRQEIGSLLIKASTIWSIGVGYKF